jgi:hypothetical protein
MTIGSFQRDPNLPRQVMLEVTESEPPELLIEFPEDSEGLPETILQMAETHNLELNNTDGKTMHFRER